VRLATYLQLNVLHVTSLQLSQLCTTGSAWKLVKTMGSPQRSAASALTAMRLARVVLVRLSLAPLASHIKDSTLSKNLASECANQIFKSTLSSQTVLPRANIVKETATNVLEQLTTALLA